MAQILIVYGTKNGHTSTIVKHMAQAISDRGHTVTIERAGRSAIPERVDGVIVGASVYAGRHRRDVSEFVRHNRQQLERMPNAFFQVCLAAAESGATAETQALIDSFTRTTGWQPRVSATFPGMLAWTRYGFPTRLLMKIIMRNKLPPEQLDTTRDVDYTDYETVRRFAADFADSVEVPGND